MGNRTNVSEDGVNKSYVPNNLNQYTTAHGIGATNGTSHQISAYDGTSYNYIGDTYLAKATAGNNSYTLFYDALGRCVQRTSVTNGGTAVTSYYLFEGEHWIMEYDSGGTNISNVLYGRGVDELISRGVQVNGVNQAWFYFPDRNGNISVVTNGTTEVLESYRYDAFGLPTITPGAGGAIGNRFLFTGREWNPAFGFYEYRARAYNPKIGRFMSEDPTGFEAGDYNLYRYVSNDPLDRVDPMGLEVYAPGTMDISPEVLQAVFASARSAALQSAASPVSRGQEGGSFLRTRLLEVRIDGYRDSGNRLRETSPVRGTFDKAAANGQGQYQAAAPKLPAGMPESQRVYSTHSHGPASEYGNNVGDRRAANDADNNGKNPLFSGVAKTATPDRVSIFVPSTSADVRSQNKGGVEITTEDGVNAVAVKKYGN